MPVTYLEKKIVESRRTATPRYGMAASGYTLRNGAPTSCMIRLEGESRWRRLMVIQFSNVGSCFVKIKGEVLYVREHLIPPTAEEKKAHG